jgi:hypothetical protein
VKFVAQVLSGVSGKDLPALIDEMKGRSARARCC